MKQRSVVILIVFIVIILIAGSSWLIYSKYIKKPMERDTLEPEDTSNIPMPVGGTSVSLGPSASTGVTPSFPIKKGMKGQLVVDVQNAVNKKCNANIVPDGVFGPKTEAAVKACYGSTTVNETVYAQMKSDAAGNTCKAGEYKVPGIGCIPVLGGTTVSSTKMKSGDPIYAKMASTLLFSAPAGNSSIGHIDSNFDLKKSIGSYQLESTGGFSKIFLTTPYVKNNGGSGPAMSTVYVYTD